MRVGTSRRAARRFTAAAVVVFGATLLLPGTPARASRPSRTGWWQTANQGPAQAPAPPDVPSGGLYVQGGPSADQPAAVAAVAFDLPSGSGAGSLRLHLASPTAGAPAPPPASPAPGPALKACVIPAGTFSSDENGPAADIPPYDCTGAVDGTVAADGLVTFAVGNLVRANALVVAIVPTAPTDRASFSPPGDDALQVVPAETFESAPSDPTPAADAGAYGGLYPTFADPVPVTGSDVSGALVTPPTTAVARPAVPRRARPITLIKPDIYSKTGQLLAIGLLLAALVAYVRGYGLLGGRLLEP